MSLEIVTAGPMLTVQDRGRTGLRHLGVSAAGPMDPEAMAFANALCGNAASAAALEFAGPAGSFRAGRDLRFAVTGGDCDIRVDGRRLVPGESHRLAAGELLTVGVPAGAVWGYLAVSGGIATEPLLGSRATHLRTGLGGLGGRCLRAGDKLPLGDAADGPCLRPRRTLPGAVPLPREAGPIRLVPGPQAGRFAPDILARLTEETFTVSPQRDRMAMVLTGVELPAAGGHDIVSDGTVPGSVQVPGSGLPLILLAESQTTGGYPKIATVASVDLPRLAQMPVGGGLRFAEISRDEAEDLWLVRARTLRMVLGELVAKPEGMLSSEYLLSCDLVGGIAAPDEIAGTDLISKAGA